MQINEIDVSNYDKIISYYREQKHQNKKPRTRVCKMASQEMLDKLRTPRKSSSEQLYIAEINPDNFIIKLTKIQEHSKEKETYKNRSLSAEIFKTIR